MSQFEISPCAGIGRINPHRLAELLDRFLIIPQLNQGRAEVIMRISARRVEPQRLSKLLYRFGEPMRLHKDPADSVMGHCLIGFDGQRKPELLKRFLRQSLPAKDNA